MSQLNFTTPELRFATGALAAITALAPALYFLTSARSQSTSNSIEPLKTFNNLIKSYSTLRPESLIATAARDFKHNVLPASLGLPSRDLAHFKQHAGMIFSLFSDFQMVPQSGESQHPVHFSSDTNTVIAHCKMGGKVNAEGEMGAKLVAGGIEEWWTECVLFVRVSADGKRVVEVKEFVDSAKAGELQRRLAEVWAD